MTIFKKLFRKWKKDENGFQVFESSMLMQGGVIIAIIVGVFVLTIVAYEYTRAENEFMGSEVEANEALQRFYP